MMCERLLFLPDTIMGLSNQLVVDSSHYLFDIYYYYPTTDEEYDAL
jgi:hypothetical protein